MKKKLCIILTLALLLPVFAGCQSASPAGGQNTQEPQASTGAAPQTGNDAAPASGTAAAITKEDAQRIALEHAGFAADQVSWLHTEYDRDDGIDHYDVDFYQGGYEYDYEIHAKTGEILKSEKEQD